MGALESTGLAKNTCAGPRPPSPCCCAFLPCSLADEIALRRHLLQQRSVRDTPRPLPLVCAFPDSSACWQWVPPWALPHRAGQAAPLRFRYPRPALRAGARNHGGHGAPEYRRQCGREQEKILACVTVLLFAANATCCAMCSWRLRFWSSRASRYRPKSTAIPSCRYSRGAAPERQSAAVRRTIIDGIWVAFFQECQQ